MAAFALIIIMTLYVLEFEHIGNTIKVSELMKIALLIGLSVGIYLGWKFQNKGEEQVDRIRIWSACIVLSLFFAPLIGSMTNRLVPRSGVKYKTFEFMEEKTISSSEDDLLINQETGPDGCHLFVYYEGAIHRLKRKRCNYANLKQGDQIKLPVRKGLWGYEFVEQE